MCESYGKSRFFDTKRSYRRTNSSSSIKSSLWLIRSRFQTFLKAIARATSRRTKSRRLLKTTQCLTSHFSHQERNPRPNPPWVANVVVVHFVVDAYGPYYITGGRRNSYLIKYSDNIMIYHSVTGGRRNCYLIKYSDNIMIYHYITGGRANS